jgi:hypothetical protein
MIGEEIDKTPDLFLASLLTDEQRDFDRKYNISAPSNEIIDHRPELSFFQQVAQQARLSLTKSKVPSIESDDLDGMSWQKWAGTNAFVAMYELMGSVPFVKYSSYYEMYPHDVCDECGKRLHPLNSSVAGWCDQCNQRYEAGVRSDEALHAPADDQNFMF